MASSSASRSSRAAQISRLDPKVNRILYVRNLPYKVTAEEIYDIFGKYGALRQIRVGAEKDNRGTAFVVYEDIFDAKAACEHLSGFNVGGRYLTVLYFQANRGRSATDLPKAQAEVDALRARVAAGEAAAGAGAGAGVGAGAAGAGSGRADDEASLGLDAEEKDRKLTGRR